MSTERRKAWGLPCDGREVNAGSQVLALPMQADAGARDSRMLRASRVYGLQLPGI